LAVALQKMGDQPRADALLAAGLARGRERNTWLADYGSPLRDPALLLALLEGHPLAAGPRGQRLFNLADEVAGQQWLSTQERKSLYLAGGNLLSKPEPSWSAALQSGSLAFTLSNAHSGLKLDSSDLAAPLSISNATSKPGDTPLYQQLTLSATRARPRRLEARISRPTANT